MAKKIFIITGDYSASVHASGVARELQKPIPDVIIEGIGESNLENAGVKLFRTHEKMGKMGITPKSIIEHFQLGLDIIKYLKEEFKPDLVLLIDYGAFNLQISKALKKAEIKTFYFIPPQIWASRKYRLKTIKKTIDKVLTIFPFEKEFYEDEGINSTYVGHPIISELPECKNKDEFFKRHNLDPNKKLIGIFPGSRIFEIKYLLNIFKGGIGHPIHAAPVIIGIVLVPDAWAGDGFLGLGQHAVFDQIRIIRIVFPGLLDFVHPFIIDQADHIIFHSFMQFLLRIL